MSKKRMIFLAVVSAILLTVFFILFAAVLTVVCVFLTDASGSEHPDAAFFLMSVTLTLIFAYLFFEKFKVVEKVINFIFDKFSGEKK